MMTSNVSRNVLAVALFVAASLSLGANGQNEKVLKVGVGAAAGKGMHAVLQSLPGDDSIAAAAISRDGKYLALSQFDEVVLVIRLEDQMVVHRIQTPYGPRALDFSPDNRYLAIGSNDVRVVDLETDKTVWLTSYDQESILRVTYGATSNDLYSVGAYWASPTRSTLHHSFPLTGQDSRPLAYPEVVRSIVWLETEKALLLGGSRGLVEKLKADRPVFHESLNFGVVGLGWDPQESVARVALTDGSFWELGESGLRETGGFQTRLKYAYFRNEQRVIAVEDGGEQRCRLLGGPSNSWSQGEAGFVTARGAVPEIGIGDYLQNIYSAGETPQGQLFVAVSAPDEPIYDKDAEHVSMNLTVLPTTHGVDDRAHPGKFVVLSDHATLELNLRGLSSRQLANPEDQITPGVYWLTQRSLQGFRMEDLRKAVRTPGGHFDVLEDPGSFATVMPIGGQVPVSDAIVAIDTNSWAKSQYFRVTRFADGLKVTWLCDVSDQGHAPQVSEDGNYLAITGSFGVENVGLAVLDAHNGRILFTRPKGDRSVNLALTSVGNLLVLTPETWAGSSEVGLSVYRLPDFKTVATLPSTIFPSEQSSQGQLFFTVDGKAIGFLGPEGSALVSLATKRPLWNLSSPIAGQTAPVRTPDGRQIIACDGSVVHIINVATGALVDFVADGNDWLYFTPDGYFEGSKNAGRLIALVQGNEAYGADQLAAKYNRPDILMERLGTTKDNPDLYAFFRANYAKRLARMGLSLKSLEGAVHLPEAKVVSLEAKGESATARLTFSDTNLDLARYTVYVNDVPLFGAEGKPLSGPTATATVDFDLIPGENKVEVSCFNTAGAESLRVLSKVQGPDPSTLPPPDLYYLGFGVSQYANADLNLRYADKDALDLEKAFQHSGSATYAHVFTKTFTNNQVDLTTMTAAKEFLAQARPQDTVILFIAGHGVFTRDSATPDYFYIAYNTDVADIEHTAIRFSEVEELLQGLPARQKLFLMDTCNSGEVDPISYTKAAAEVTQGTQARAVRGISVVKLADTQKSPVPRTWLAEKGRYSQNDLIRRSGAIVFSSSKGGEYSYESEKLGNGMFTSAILKVLDGELEVAKDENGNIGVRALVEAVSAEVPKMTDELQHPGVDRDNLSVNFALPVSELPEANP